MKSRKSLQDVRDDPTLRSGCATLLSDVPKITVDKFGAAEMQTDEQRARRLLNLVVKHRGEVVEIDLASTTWHLRKGPHPEEVFQQFLCQPETQ